MIFHLGHTDGDADAITPGYISLHHFNGADLDAAEPVHFEFRQPILKGAADRFVARHRDQRFLDAIALPEFLRRGELAALGDEQHQRDLEHRHRIDACRRFATQQSHRQINFLLLQPVDDLRVITFPQGHFEFRELFVQLLKHGRQVIAQ